MNWRLWHRALKVPRGHWLIAAHTDAYVLHRLTELAVSDGTLDYRPEMIRHARHLLETIADSLRAEVPISDSVLALKR